jgi:hypothetical protein
MAKYRPEVPVLGFDSLGDARDWAAQFVRWHNVEHRHNGICCATLGQRPAGHDHAILAARHPPYRQAQERHPARWSGATRDGPPIEAVMLNPERDAVVKSAADHQQTHLEAAWPGR